MTNIVPVIETERLVLRAPTLADLPAITTFFASEQSHMVGGPRDALGADKSFNAMVGAWGTRGYGMWAIADRDTDAYLGRTGFIFAPGWDEPELGWALIAEAEGKGIAYEATLSARAYGAQHLNLDGVISYIDPKNPRSEALATRLGATIERPGELLGKPCNIWRHPRQEAT